MADLENNLESIEEVKQPHDGAEKGDSKPVKQGSSDAAEIGSGKVEVVKPEENPVDKAVASVKKAETAPSNEGDAQKKNAGKADKADSIKEDEKESKKDELKASKMESIKAIVNNMKEMTKEDIQSILGTISEEEVDESLTKAEVARKVVESLKSMTEEEVAETYGKLNANKKKEDEEGEQEEEEKSVSEEISSELESSLVEIEIDDDLSAISEALDLSEENAEKAKTIFKAAVSSKVQEVSEELKSQYEAELKTTVETVKGDLSEAVDKYLTYCAEEWTKENELAIERGLRSEMTENFIEGLKTLFVEHYVDVPEDKYDVIDELANRLDEMEAKLDSEVSKNMEIVEENDQLKRSNVIEEACKDLTESQTEKMVSLSEGVDFSDIEDFQEKVNELKEAYFPIEGETMAEETIEVEGIGTLEEETSSEKVLDPTMNKYATALRKLKPLG